MASFLLSYFFAVTLETTGAKNSSFKTLSSSLFKGVEADSKNQ